MQESGLKLEEEKLHHKEQEKNEKYKYKAPQLLCI